MKPVMVRWWDAHGPTVDWGALPMGPQDIEITEVHSFGFLIEGENAIILIPNYVPETKECFGQTTIPRGCIIEIVEFEY